MTSKYEYVKAWRKRNPGCRTEEARKRYAKYPEKAAARSKKWREKNLEANREHERLKQAEYRKTKPELQALRMARYNERKRQKQIEIAGRPKPDMCEVCKEMNLRIVFDHCHVTGKFRGWLCDRCNKVLGLLKDDAKLFIALASYLKGK